MHDQVYSAERLNEALQSPVLALIEPLTLTRTCMLSILRQELASIEIIDMATTRSLDDMSTRDIRLVALSIGDKPLDDPAVDLVGIPEKNTEGEPLDDLVFDVVVTTIEGLPKAKRRDPDALAESVRRAVRSALSEPWGKKPICLVHVLEV